MRTAFLLSAAFGLAVIAGVSLLWPPALWSLVIVVPLIGLGIRDMFQDGHAVLRNFPVIGHGRYLFERIRPEMNQYFIESNTDGRPFSREARSVVYQRAKTELDTLPFGTQLDTSAVGYEWIAHSLTAHTGHGEPPRITVGGEQCKRPYKASLLNVSAMSYGSLSKNAILALNGGAARGGFAHNTGEGGLSPYHLGPGGDLIWQIGTGYFGCRTQDGDFDPGLFHENASRSNVKMIELKLSQGAKPGHGGILPAKKVTLEIAQIRNVPMGQDVLSPPSHRTFDTPIGLLEFVATLRDRSDGKPVGFKLCVGDPVELAAIMKAIVATEILPDFITVDGGEGGTGAAPIEFSNAVGMPLFDGLSLTHNLLVGFDLRHKIKVIASGNVITGFDLATRLAAGADLCSSARAMMFALGCIQALRCNSNKCPTGVATQHPGLVAGLVVEDKAQRVFKYHAATVRSLMELLGACGIAHPDDLRPWHIHRRLSVSEVKTYQQIYRYHNEAGSLLAPPYPDPYGRYVEKATPERFRG